MPRFYTYHIRIGNSSIAMHEGMLNDYAMWLHGQCTKIFAVREYGKHNEGLHSHQVCVFYDVKEQTARKRLLQRFPYLKGRGKYSIKLLETDADIDRCTTYLCKGPTPLQMPTVIENNLLSQENIIERHAKYWEHARVGTDVVGETVSELTGSVVAMPEAPKKPKPTAVQAIAEILEDNNEGHHWMMNEEDMQTVYMATMRYLGRKGKTLDVIIVRRICLGVLNILAHDDLSNELWRRLFPEFIK